MTSAPDAANLRADRLADRRRQIVDGVIAVNRIGNDRDGGSADGGPDDVGGGLAEWRCVPGKYCLVPGLVGHPSKDRSQRCASSCNACPRIGSARNFGFPRSRRSI